MFYESQVTITCLGDYIDEIVKLKQENNDFLQWYRGHADISWELIPKVQRGFNGNEEEVFRKERECTNNFQSRASVLLSTQKPKLSEYGNWLTIMQHYGISTRLLDWSRSPLIALYFALADKNNNDKDACIWILTPGKLNASEKPEKTTNFNGKEYENSFIYNMAHNTITTMIYTAFKRWELSGHADAITPDDKKFNYRFNDLKDKIVACYPTEADSRVYNQHAAFTVHNSLRRLVDICDESTLLRITIPFQVKEQLRYELSVCGITESYIFPDLEHLAKELNG